ncbi:hypothetical protein J1N35_034838 [Gossypium stocksii]|uniref:Uncharacterized protein n=1 Tax=Gossypium stocksii TaxID=47602 RepID=A0A9D3USV7_9ROSI|nr:hypothetical protein J1N35_034838 [Gossypium stocksii]
MILARAQSMELTFNPTIQLLELRTRIRRKVGGSTRGRILRLQCRYLAFVNLYSYDLFDVNGELQLEEVISSHVSSRNVVMELFVEFAKANESGPSSAIVAANVGTKVKAESLTIQLCDRFTGLLQSSYYDVLKTFMGSTHRDNESVDDEEDADKKKDVGEEEDADKEEKVTTIVEKMKSDPDLI